jgi:hypothetical protein
MADKGDKPFFIFDTHGDWQATRMGNLLFDTRGEYIGFVVETDVYKADGEWVGQISRDNRIVRKRAGQRKPAIPNPPAKPPKPTNLPARAPLPPMPSELSYDIIDVMEEDPEIFKRVSDLKKDMD